MSTQQIRAEQERLRQDLEAFPAHLVNWEATCLKKVADLLDSLNEARAEWDALNSKLAQAESGLADAERVRERLAEVLPEVAALRNEMAQMRRDVAVAEEKQARVAEETARLEEAAATEVESTRAELETIIRERDLLAENAQNYEATRAELEETRTQLAQTREALRQAGEAAPAGDDAARIEKLRQDNAALKAECEQNLVVVCELRVRINRLESERDEALRTKERKVKRILGKIHGALDAAGAPSGEDLSFTRRIGILAERAGLGAFDDAADDSDQASA